MHCRVRNRQHSTLPGTTLTSQYAGSGQRTVFADEVREARAVRSRPDEEVDPVRGIGVDQRQHRGVRPGRRERAGELLGLARAPQVAHRVRVNQNRTGAGGVDRREQRAERAALRGTGDAVRADRERLSAAARGALGLVRGERAGAPEVRGERRGIAPGKLREQLVQPRRFHEFRPDQLVGEGSGGGGESGRSWRHGGS